MKTWNPREHCHEDRKDVEAFIEEYVQLYRKHNMQFGAYEEDLYIEDIDERYLDFNGVLVYFEERK